MIYIDFQGGAHGNFLEFVCNKHLAGVATEGLPFNTLGAAHSKKYTEPRVFRAQHFFDHQGPTISVKDSKIVSIRIVAEDLLPLSSISLLRAGNHNIDNDLLHVDTFNKLSNPSGIWILKTITERYFQNQAKQSYDAVRDPSWPEIHTVEDFRMLPQWIQDECRDLHGLRLLQLDATHPDCPRQILREFFKIGFRDPENSGFMLHQKNTYYDASNQIHEFKFATFYDTEQFVSEVDRIGEFVGYKIIDLPGLQELHQQFLQRQPYKYARQECDELLDQIFSGESFVFPRLYLMKEAYLEARIEEHYKKQIFSGDQWFPDSDTLNTYLSES